MAFRDPMDEKVKELWGCLYSSIARKEFYDKLIDKIEKAKVMALEDE